jgi:hypothetical protein
MENLKTVRRRIPPMAFLCPFLVSGSISDSSISQFQAFLEFLPESNGPARLTMAVLGRPPGARVHWPRRASEGAARCTWWATISAETAGERKTLEDAATRCQQKKSSRELRNCCQEVTMGRISQAIWSCRTKGCKQIFEEGFKDLSECTDYSWHYMGCT